MSCSFNTLYLVTMKFIKEIHYLYKITNLINNHFYYGIRTCHCFPGSDSYMGSGVRLHRAYRKYGIENFKKEIIKVCKTREDLLKLEYDIVNEDLVNDYNCYNIVRGGGKDSFYGGVLVKDSDGFPRMISKEEFNKGGYEGYKKNKISVIDNITKERITIDILEYRENKSRYSKLGINKSNKGLVLCKDKNGNILHISKHDPRYLSKEVNPIWTGRKHSEESKRKISIANSSRLGSRNSQYGKIWIYNKLIRKSIKIYPDEFYKYEIDGWIKGRKLKF